MGQKSTPVVVEQTSAYDTLVPELGDFSTLLIQSQVSASTVTAVQGLAEVTDA